MQPSSSNATDLGAASIPLFSSSTLGGIADSMSLHLKQLSQSVMDLKNAQAQIKRYEDMEQEFEKVRQPGDFIESRMCIDMYEQEKNSNKVLMEDNRWLKDDNAMLEAANERWVPRRISIVNAADVVSRTCRLKKRIAELEARI
jgi:hypothetical protein